MVRKKKRLERDYRGKKKAGKSRNIGDDRKNERKNMESFSGDKSGLCSSEI